MQKNEVNVRFSYEIFTEESAQSGEAERRGWYVSAGPGARALGGALFDIDDKEASAGETMSASHAIREIEDHVGPIDSVSAGINGSNACFTFYPADSSDNYITGDESMVTAHVRGDLRLLRVIRSRLER